MDIQRKARRIKRMIDSGAKNNVYIKALKRPINDKAFLFEAGQGKTVNGNVFALLRYIRKSSEYNDHTIYLSVTEDTEESAKERLDHYGLSNVNLVIRDSAEYKKALGSFRYLITDNSFPGYLNKRKDQIYINTWHGTPLKALGRTDIENSASLANVQANMLKADYLLHPNEFTKNIMMNDYMVEKLFKNKTVVIDYPRNDALYSKEYEEEILTKYNLKGKRLIAYMPTWRGLGRAASIEEQVEDVERIVKEMAGSLKEDEIICVNLHFLVGNRIDFSNYKNVISFPKEYETYDFLALCDTLITDYSSVAIDFAGTGREVILYMYDYDQYKANKGFYLDIKSLPFKQAETQEELEKALHSKKEEYELNESLLSKNRGDSSRRIVDLLCNGKEDGLEIQDYSGNEKEKNLVFFENINREENQRLLRLYQNKLTKEEKHETIIAFQDKITPEVAGVLRSLEEGIDYIRIPRGFKKNTAEVLAVAINKKTGLFKKAADRFYRREAERILQIMALNKVTVMQNRSIEKFNVLSKAEANTSIYIHPSYFYGRNGWRFLSRPLLYKRIIDKYKNTETFTAEEESTIWDGLKCYGTNLTLKAPRYSVEDDYFEASGTVDLTVDADCTILDNAIVSEREYRITRKPECIKRDDGITQFTGAFSLRIPLWDMEDFHKHNRIFLQMSISGSTILIPLRYSSSRTKQKTYFEIGEGEEICNIRNSNGFLDFEIRPSNHTDAVVERAKLYFAWFCSAITPFYKPVVLYEKECSRYEEGASCVYERLIDKGYKNAYFILSKDYAFRDSIAEKYKKNLINRFSFKHYYSIFAAKTLISTEALAHALESNSKSKVFINNVVEGSQNYVFLQHGVMYMVSLNSESRSFFRKKRSKGIQKVVVSSDIEAKHFIDYAGYREADMYISGLPKFDKSYLEEGADTITVMLTWRPWEYNQASNSFENTNYYKMTERIVAAVPDEYRDKLVVLPHPKMSLLAEKDKEDNVWKYAIFGKKYDDILKQTKLLITDYSSISFDAFYRGSNIIFCWSEKDDCMKEYGPSTKLMLTDDTAFGPVAYDENIRDLIRQQYEDGQSELYRERYRKIVNFHDGHNTDRVIEMMIKDMII